MPLSRAGAPAATRECRSGSRGRHRDAAEIDHEANADHPGRNVGERQGVALAVAIMRRAAGAERSTSPQASRMRSSSITANSKFSVRR